MTQTDRAVRVVKRLCVAYPDRAPLLRFTSPYELLISVILSAQTTDAQVNEVTPELFRRYPSPADLAAAGQSDVERLVHSTGFYRTKARNIIGAASAINADFAGRVPESFDELLSIPGVGRKSANVIRGVVYGKPSIVVDTHLMRVSNRLGFVSGGNPVAVERALQDIVPERLHTDFSMSLNLHGRRRCRSRKPDCSECEIRDLCPYPDGGRTPVPG